MAVRYPLVIDTTDNNKIKELPANDSLNLNTNSIVNAVNITASGTLTVANLVVDSNSVSINGNPLGTVALTNSYTDLSNKPSLFDGTYAALTGRPSIPASTEDLSDVGSTQATNGQALIYDTSLGRYEPGNIADASIDLTNQDLGELQNVVLTGAVANQILKYNGTAFVNTTVHFSEITNKPTTLAGFGITDAQLAGAPHDGDIEGSVFGDDSTLLVDGVNNKIVGTVDTASLTVSSTDVTIGLNAGQTDQGSNAIAIGYNAGQTNQGPFTLAVSQLAGQTNQGQGAIALGYASAFIDQGVYATSIGPFAGYRGQGARALSIGISAGYRDQGTYAVAIGPYTGYKDQGLQATAVGYNAGHYDQGQNATAIGYRAGAGISIFKTYVSGGVGSTTLVVNNTTGIVAGMALINSTAYTSGQTVVSVDSGTSLTISAVADGTPSFSGIQFSSGGQGLSSVAIGSQSGERNQGTHAVAIGMGAGNLNQAANSIVINATGTTVQNTTASSLVIKPIRNATMTTILGYDVTTGEVTHNAAIPGYTNTADLKALVAASADFADYQTRIAAL